MGDSIKGSMRDDYDIDPSETSIAWAVIVIALIATAALATIYIL